MSTIADSTFQESLQGLANWIQYLELKQAMYSRQLERARKQSPAADAGQTGNAGAAQSVFSDMDALKAAPAPVAAAPQATGLGDDWLVAEPQVEISDDGLGDSWMPASSNTPDDADPVMTPWREDDPEMAAWDLDDDSGDPIGDAWAIASEVMGGVDPSTENSDAGLPPSVSPGMAIPVEDDSSDDDPDDALADEVEESDDLPPSWL